LELAIQITRRIDSVLLALTGFPMKMQMASQ
jgi:hypothetical protein